MRPSPRKPLDDLDELRQLLIRPEQEELRELHDRLDDKEQRAHEIADVLPEAVILSRDRGSEELTRALRPAVEGSVRESIEKRPEVFIDALYPIIGPIVRRSIAERFRELLQSLNQTLEHTFSWQGLKWRFEAWRTGKSFAEVVMLRSLVYRVEQVFLIHRETSLPLLHVTADPALSKDSGMVAGMLSAIEDFAHDSLSAGEDSALEADHRFGELHVWLAPGRYAYLAASIRGNPPRDLHSELEESIESIHVLKGSALATFEGEPSVFESLRPELEACLREQRQAKRKATDHNRAWFAIAATGALVVAALLVGARNEKRWQDFVRRLHSAPGIAVTQAQKNWIFRSRVAGLRDPAVADPYALARAAGVDPKRIRFEWKDYLALDDASVLRRLEQRFGKPAGTNLRLTNGALLIGGAAPYEWLTHVRQQAPQLPGITSINDDNVTTTFDPGLVLARLRNAFPPPPGVTATVENGTLVLSGTAPYEWVAPVRDGAPKLPGIQKISEDYLQIAYDPRLVLQRFSDRFNLPDTVNADVQNGILVLSGEAPHAWLGRVRRGAPGLPGIQKIDEHNLTDLDQRAYQQSKSVIESAFVYFLLNKDNFATEGFAALSRLPDEIRRCLTATNRLGLAIEIQVRGYADSVGPEQKNFELSQRRAEAVRDFLIKCGFEPSLFKAMGMGAPPPATNTPAPEQADRRVALKVAPKL
jgi:outer membrane protein OmpA-like peptidoglycan-associated protein